MVELAKVGRIIGPRGRGFLPTSVPNLKLWTPFDADGKYFTRANGLIQTWADQSGNGNDLTQATAANRPVDGSVGSNLVTNGTFDADTDWTKGGTWAIAAGVASCTGTGNNLISEANVVTSGTIYIVTFDVNSGTVAAFYVNDTGNLWAATGWSAGTHSFVAAAPATGKLLIRSNGSEIDNVTVQEITQDGTVYFDGIQRFLQAAFTFNQPESIYILFKHVTWTSNRFIADGGAASNSAGIRQKAAGSSGDIDILTGATTLGEVNLPVGQYGVLSAVFNSTSSVLQLNNETPVTGDVGTGNAAGLTLGAQQDGSPLANIQAAEVIAYAAAHDDALRAQFFRYLSAVQAKL